jgi:glutathione S-transferase
MANRVKLYGSPFSGSTVRVTLLLDEAGFTDYDFVTINIMKGENRVSFACDREQLGDTG